MPRFQGFKLVLLFIVSFLAGIWLGDFVIRGEIFKFFLLVCFIFSLVFKVFGFRFVCVFILLLGFFSGAFRYFLAYEFANDDLLSYQDHAKIVGCISEDPELKSNGRRYVLENVSGKTLVFAPLYPVFKYGDCIEFEGRISEPEDFDDFSYKNYLSRYGIYTVTYIDRGSEIRKIEGDFEGKNFDQNFFLSSLISLRNIFERNLYELFPAPGSSFMAGLILGERSDIPFDVMSNFNAAGLTHIVAISGYNITILVVLINGLFVFLDRRKRVFASIVFIFIFVVFVGASASVVRAAIMGAIGLMAIYFGREYFVTLSLFSAAFFMNLINPKIILYDTGFALSFLATAGLIYVSPLIKKYFKWVPEFFSLRESVVMTISAQIMALPVIIFNFGSLSLISPIANMFVLPFIPWLMLFGFLSALLKMFSGFFAMLIAFPAYIVMTLIFRFIELISSFNFSSIEIGQVSWWLIFLYYFFLIRFLTKNVDF